MLVLAIFTAPTAGAPMQRVGKVSVLAGRGIIGDRYEAGIGAFSRKRPEVRDLSLISEEALRRANQGRSDPFTASDTRRNLLVSVDVETLNSLVNHEFTIGNIRVRGMELCDPCQRPSALSGKPGFAAAFAGIGGLRVQVLNDGELAENDVVSFESNL